MLNELADKCYHIAIDKGFNEYNGGNFNSVVPRDLMLIVSELGEALEAIRNNKFLTPEMKLYYVERMSQLPQGFSMTTFDNVIKDTFEDEIADAMIRLLHLSAMLDIDIDFHVNEKLLYNSKREYKHGNKAF